MSHTFIGQNVHGLQSAVFIPGFSYYGLTGTGEKNELRAPSDLYPTRLQIGTSKDDSSYANVALTVDQADKLLEIDLAVESYGSETVFYMTATRSSSDTDFHPLYAGILLLQKPCSTHASLYSDADDYPLEV